jgi:hypothetical protein
MLKTAETDWTDNPLVYQLDYFQQRNFYQINISFENVGTPIEVMNWIDFTDSKNLFSGIADRHF